MSDQTEEIALRWDRQSQTYVLNRSRLKKFLKGPVPWHWIERAAKLPGKALHVGIALWRLVGAMNAMTVKLGNREVESLGVDRNAKSRALKKLAEAGLITIDQRPGRLPVVTLLEVGK